MTHYSFTQGLASPKRTTEHRQGWLKNFLRMRKNLYGKVFRTRGKVLRLYGKVIHLYGKAFH